MKDYIWITSTDPICSGFRIGRIWYESGLQKLWGSPEGPILKLQVQGVIRVLNPRCGPEIIMYLI
jgi:hypothetical protein